VHGGARARGQKKRPQTVQDFRRVLDDKSIDVLVVGTPDHWHAIPTILACQAGKHVYVEKPCSHNVREGQAMLAAARRYKKAVQVGIRTRSARHFLDALDYIRSGKIGKMTSGWARRRSARSTRTAFTEAGGGSSITAPATWVTTASTASTTLAAVWRRDSKHADRRCRTGPQRFRRAAVRRQDA
jgi:predicted dehydrogenase